jgi:WD40 repeat protein
MVLHRGKLIFHLQNNFVPRVSVGGPDDLIQLWTVTDFALLWSTRHTYNVNKLTFSPDGKVLTNASNDSTAACVDLPRTELHLRCRHFWVEPFFAQSLDDL